MDFMPLRLNSSSLTCSICALAAFILQLVAMENQKLHMVDSPIVSLKERARQRFFSLAVYIASLDLGNLLPRNLSETSGLHRFQYRMF